MKAAEAGMLVMVHAENGDVIDVLVKEALAKGHRSPEWHALTRPAWAEAEATMRATALAGIAGAPLYVVHVTNSLAVDQIAYGRARGLSVMGETCTQYLFFTIDNLRQPDGAKWVCSPPMRTPADNAALWQALGNNSLQAVSTDHCPFFYDGTQPIEYEGQPIAIPGKELGQDSFDKIPNGVPGIEDRMPILWTYGVGQGHFSLNRLVEIGCTNPAKIFGLYPRKGTIAVGADADVVIWDPQAVKTMGATDLAPAHRLQSIRGLAGPRRARKGLSCAATCWWTAKPGMASRAVAPGSSAAPTPPSFDCPRRAVHGRTTLCRRHGRADQETHIFLLVGPGRGQPHPHGQGQGRLFLGRGRQALSGHELAVDVRQHRPRRPARD